MTLEEWIAARDTTSEARERDRCGPTRISTDDVTDLGSSDTTLSGSTGSIPTASEAPRRGSMSSGPGSRSSATPNAMTDGQRAEGFWWVRLDDGAPWVVVEVNEHGAWVPGDEEEHRTEGLVWGPYLGMEPGDPRDTTWAWLEEQGKMPRITVTVALDEVDPPTSLYEFAQRGGKL